MWGPEQQEAFARDGVVTLRGAVDPEAAGRMAEAVWRYVEHRTDVDREDPTTWPTDWLQLSFKKLKRHTAFRAVLESPATIVALDGIFGAGRWRPSRSGAQILFSFPDTEPDAWRVPHRLWHMDAPFHRRIDPPRAVKLFTVAERLGPRSGATMVLAGTPELQARYAATVPPVQRQGTGPQWRAFLTRTDPWLARFADADDGGDDRNEVLSRPHVVDGHPVELRELGGEPGDVHVTHINLYHSGSPNAGDRPRMLVTHLVAPEVPDAGSDDGGNT